MTLPLIRRLAVCGGLFVYLVMARGSLYAEPIGLDSMTPAGAAEKAPQEVEDAAAVFGKGDYNGAFKHLQEAEKAHPELSPAEVFMAQWFFQAWQQTGQQNANLILAMRNWLERGVQRNPDDPEAYLVLGEIALQEGRVTEADLLYNRAASLMKTFKGNTKRKQNLEPRILGGQAAVGEARQDWGGAQNLLETWLKLDAKNANIMQRLARALFQQKKPTESLDMLKKAKEADSEVLTPEARLALFYEAFGDHKNAVKWMEFAIKAAKTDLNTLLVAAQWALETEQFDKAKEWAAAAMQHKDQKSPQAIQAKILRGVVALFQQDYKEAEVYFETAVLQQPTNFAASNNLALALIEQSKDPQKQRRALDYAALNFKTYPRSAEAASTYGWVLYKSGKIEEAERALTLALSAGSVSADTAFYLASVYADPAVDRPEEAKRFLKAALESKRPFTKKEDARYLLERLERLTRGSGKSSDSGEKPAAKTDKGGTKKGG